VRSGSNGPPGRGAREERDRRQCAEARHQAGPVADAEAGRLHQASDDARSGLGGSSRQERAASRTGGAGQTVPDDLHHLADGVQRGARRCDGMSICALQLQARVLLPASRALPQVHLDQGPLRQSDLTGAAGREPGTGILASHGRALQLLHGVARE